jgi:hypothetical protein
MNQHLHCARCGRGFQVNDEAENHAFYCPDCCAGTDPDEHFVLVPPTEDEILSRAISHYGEPTQVLKCIEELAELGVELITALSGDSHYFRIDAVELTRCLNNVIDMCKYELPSDTSEIKLRVLSETDINDIASELTDVALTTSQMLKIFNCLEEVEKIKQEKLSRLEARMGGDSQ